MYVVDVAVAVDVRQQVSSRGMDVRKVGWKNGSFQGDSKDHTRGVSSSVVGVDGDYEFNPTPFYCADGRHSSRADRDEGVLSVVHVYQGANGNGAFGADHPPGGGERVRLAVRDAACVDSMVGKWLHRAFADQTKLTPSRSVRPVASTPGAQKANISTVAGSFRHGDQQVHKRASEGANHTATASSSIWSTTPDDLHHPRHVHDGRDARSFTAPLTLTQCRMP